MFSHQAAVLLLAVPQGVLGFLSSGDVPHVLNDPCDIALIVDEREGKDLEPFLRPVIISEQRVYFALTVFNSIARWLGHALHGLSRQWYAWKHFLPLMGII